MKKIISIIIMVGVMLTAAVCLTSCGTKIDMSEYVTITFDGADGYARASVEIDEEKLNELVNSERVSPYFDKLFAGNSMLSSMLDTSQAVFTDCIDVVLTEDYNNLKNGDVVTAEVVVSGTLEDFGQTLEDVEKNVKVSFKSTTIEATVEGLEEMEVYNPFDDLKVVFQGMDSEGEIYFDKDRAKELYKISFSASKEDGLKNGDKVTVKAELNCSQSDFISAYEKAFDDCEKEYTVSGLPAYITSLSDISETDNEKIDKALQDAFTATTADWDSDVKVLGIELVDRYLLNLKDGLSTSYDRNQNYLYYVYKITFQIPDGTDSYYWYGYYEDVCKEEDGTISIELDKYKMVDTSYYFSTEKLKSGKYYFYGYVSTDALFKAQVTARVDKYTYEKQSQ